MSGATTSGVVTRDDVHDPAAAPGAELHGAGRQREQRVVAATADVRTGVEVGAALADDDLAGADDLAAVPLDAQALGVGVAAVLGGRRTLLVCHLSSPCAGRPSGLDVGDLDLGVLLAVALALLVTRLVLELLD